MLRYDKRGTREMGILNNESVRNSLPLPSNTKVKYLHNSGPWTCPLGAIQTTLRYNDVVSSTIF